MYIIEDVIAKELSNAFKSCFNADVAADTIKFQKTHFGFNGDITFVVFPFLKITKNTPDNTSKILGDYLIKNSSDVVDVEIVKGFLNISISDNYYISWLKENFRKNFKLGYLPNIL